jgi:CBS domain-containing protein
MDIRALYNSPVITVKATDELYTATNVMREQHVGYVVVVESVPLGGWSRPVGVLTDRDIVVSVLAKGLDPKAVTVGDVMTRQPLVVAEDKSLEFALEEMRRVGVRRVPVVGAAGQLLGLLSLDDAIQHLARQLFEVAGSIRKEIRVEESLRP